MSERRYINAGNLEDFLLTQGWVADRRGPDQLEVELTHVDHPEECICLPSSTTYSGIEHLTERCLLQYLRLTGESDADIRYRIAHVHSDTIRIRVFGGPASEGMPLNYVNKVAQALRTFLRTGFRIATSQSDNKAIGNTEEAYTRNLRATLETERYETFMEYRLACPLGLSRVEFEARGVGIATPIVRRVMLAIHDQIGELYDTIVNREQREFLSSARQSGWNDTSASFVEAFLNLFDVDRGYSLEVRFLWGGGFPNEGRHLAQPLTFRSGDSLFVHDLYHAMACREESDVYVGVLAHLQRGQGAASAVGPRAVLTLLLANGDVIPAHVDLSEAQYSKARQAQESGHQYVRVGGVLETVDQPGQLARLELTRLTEFDVIG